uniref:Zeaxanthin epoxidase, chloroplastic n=1 Tax=Kalanchoe fedtschenkoi TaxID=63787 RepID=A0A7N0TNG8_KALFE
MASALIHSSFNPSTSVFSRTQNPVLHPTLEFFPSVCFSRRNKLTPGKCNQIKATDAVDTGSSIERLNGLKPNLKEPQRNMTLLVTGGGIGGLVFALAARKRGFKVIVFEKDLSAIRGEGQYRGPIQIQSNALAALEAIDMDVAEEVMRAGCVTGDRINGLVDGMSGNWYIKFDTFTPAAERGLPVTRVISRIKLQQILACAVGEDVIMNASNVVNFKDDGDKVTVELENGERFEGDLLVGADGIWSKVRKNLFGETDVVYSGYTCYTGIADFVPADIESVGYRVFLGHKQYFVSSDVGAGKMQWYAFHKEPAGGEDIPNGKKERLLNIFKGWCDNVIDLIHATDEEAILRRDIYDRIPSLTWGKGRVTLLGDSIHAMQPNLGQGGCMAIEDSYQLAIELEKACKRSAETGTSVDVVSALRSYENSRKLRVAVIHGLARMAAIMASTYKAYLGVGLGPLSFLTELRIPHPGRVGGRVFIDIAMPAMLSWVLGGNSSNLEGRPSCCRLSDKASNNLRTWFEDDDALERTISGEWFLLPSAENVTLQPICLSRNEAESCIIGSEGDSCSPGTSVVLPYPEVSPKHARISYKDGAFFVTDLRSEHGTWICDVEGKRYRIPPNFPFRIRASDTVEFGSDRKVAFRVKVLRSPEKIAVKSLNQEALQVA